MSDPTITFDIRNLTAYLDDVRRRQVPFALSLAINRTLDHMQEAVRRQLPQVFTIRSTASGNWLRRAIKINRYDRATKANPVGRVRIEASGKGGGRAGLLGFLEGGGVRYSQFAVGSGMVFGASSVVVPARLTRRDTVPRSLYPSMTGLQERRAIDGTRTTATLKGKRRTFAVRTKRGEGLILQRKGKGGLDGPRQPGQRDPNVLVLFLIKPRVSVRGRDFFFRTAEATALARFEGNMDQAMAQAMRTAR